MKHAYRYLFLGILGLSGLVMAILSTLYRLREGENFKGFMSLLTALMFLAASLRYLLKYRKSSTGARL